MSGPILLLLVFVVIILLVKYQTHAKKVFADIGQTTGGLKNAITTKSVITTLLVIAGAVLVYWGFNTQVRPADMGSWGREHWFPILILWGVLAALIALNATGATMKMLQKVVAGVMLLLFVVAPVVAWIAKDGGNEQKLEPVLLMPANGDSPRIRTKPGYAIDYTGSGFTIHCVYRDGSEGVVGDRAHPCKDGPMLYQYVRDTTGKTNTATYAFVRPN